ncbi:hypothetical protein BU24DRAFT_134777 [Aaosphaeria arxii CBS 175.79]|uniref:Uncharacterized protein n=1 Tax=Aaosphaeria arxii CBS 175.79 TaxID=1450172 RepID=A0A6A5Y4I5_9PLEO|nr:uncharacterized protein BU24DRAFT_134777 [Aaosphaeria arxii CBS 175.79]KAF2020166.1 hypothetical protein BU24DRAFT_134777 [Aaosphaeria arxii CBS 175.79]
MSDFTMEPLQSSDRTVSKLSQETQPSSPRSSEGSNPARRRRDDFANSLHIRASILGLFCYCYNYQDDDRKIWEKLWDKNALMVYSCELAAREIDPSDRPGRDIILLNKPNVPMIVLTTVKAASNMTFENWCFRDRPMSRSQNLFVMVPTSPETAKLAALREQQFAWVKSLSKNRRAIISASLGKGRDVEEMNDTEGDKTLWERLTARKQSGTRSPSTKSTEPRKFLCFRW